ncbi:hypothetical protein, partial [Paenibacillus sp. 32O-W]|uniref:hypothetical protein n=1 Tax=Paenibacillus sp. 32O-W TaxID=1695218 RepID=UPI0037C723A4
MRGKIVGIIFFIFFIISACSGEKEYKSIYYSGENWNVHIDNRVLEDQGQKYFNIEYTFTGTIDVLQEIKHIAFAQGTSLDTQVVNLFDNTQKEKLIKEGSYSEEETKRLEIIYMDLQHKVDNSFIISYKFLDSQKFYSIKKRANRRQYQSFPAWI